MSVCNVSKLLFGGYKPPHESTKAAFEKDIHNNIIKKQIQILLLKQKSGQ